MQPSPKMLRITRHPHHGKFGNTEAVLLERPGTLARLEGFRKHSSSRIEKDEMGDEVIIDQYVEIYKVGGLAALNSTLASMQRGHRADVLKALERSGFQIEWHEQPNSPAAPEGVVWSGPK